VSGPDRRFHLTAALLGGQGAFQRLSGKGARRRAACGPQYAIVDHLIAQHRAQRCARNRAGGGTGGVANPRFCMTGAGLATAIEAGAGAGAAATGLRLTTFLVVAASAGWLQSARASRPMPRLGNC